MEWKHKLKIKEDWKLAKAEQITIPELCKRIAPKLKQIATIECDDFQIDDIVNDLEAMAGENEISKKDFDLTWEQLYDWADQEVEIGSRLGKMCWIETF